MKIDKLSNYYTEEERDHKICVSMIDSPLLRALSNQVEGLEVTKDEFIHVVRFAMANNCYHLTITETKKYHVVLGMILIII